MKPPSTLKVDYAITPSRDEFVLVVADKDPIDVESIFPGIEAARVATCIGKTTEGNYGSVKEFPYGNANCSSRAAFENLGSMNGPPSSIEKWLFGVANLSFEDSLEALSISGIHCLPSPQAKDLAALPILISSQL